MKTVNGTTSHVIAPSRQRLFADGSPQPTSNLIPFDRWLQSIDKTPATGWRWRQRGWIVTVNICGRVYVSRDEIKRFEERAAGGEFSKVHVTPARKPCGSMIVQPGSSEALNPQIEGTD